MLDNQQHLRTDTHHTAAVEFNRQNQNKGSLDFFYKLYCYIVPIYALMKEHKTAGEATPNDFVRRHT